MRHDRPALFSRLVRYLAIVGAAAVIALPVVVAPPAAPPAAAATAKAPRLFKATSPYNTPIPARPAVDPKSATMSRWLGGGEWNALIHEYSAPIYHGRAGMPTVTVRCTMPWGTCASEGHRIRLPRRAVPSSGTDGALVVVDRPSGRVYDFWQVRREKGRLVASWSTHVPLRSVGVGARWSGSTGGGINVVNGMVRLSEMRRAAKDINAIRHALSLATANSCSNGFRHPASKTDGRSTRSDCIPEGARIQLHPRVRCGQVTGGYGVRAICRALQTYGAYNRDNSGAHVGVALENPHGKQDPYPAAGLAWDYFDLARHIPLEGNLRVLRHWTGG